MDTVNEGAQNWLCTVSKIKNSTINVTMAGKNEYNKVCTGLPRSGSIQVAGNSYDVKLPGIFVPHSFAVTFNRQ